MTIRKIFIPFDTRKKQGFLTIPVLSQQEFCTAASRVEKVFLTRFYTAKPLIYFLSKSSHLFFPLRTTLNQFIEEKNEGLKLVCEGNRMWLGFIPFFDPVQRTENPIGRGRKSMHHYRLDGLANLMRWNVSSNKISIFSLPFDAQLQQSTPDQCCSILNLSFLLVFNYEQDKCSLLCCDGLLPLAPFVPIFCFKQVVPGVPYALLEQAKNLAVPFLAGKNNGIFHFPILSLDQWNKEIKNNPMTSTEKCVFQATLIVFPTSASFKPSQGLQGLRCVCLQEKNNYLKLGFFPTVAGDKLYNTSSYDCFQTLLETVPSRSRNHNLSGNASSFVILDSNKFVRTQKDSSVLALTGSSLFLLASEDGRTCGLFYMKGDFELKCTRPTHPEGGFLPIEKLLEQFPSEGPPEKRARVEEQEKTSQEAVEESRKTEEARRACAEALMLFSQQE